MKAEDAEDAGDRRKRRRRGKRGGRRNRPEDGAVEAAGGNISSAARQLGISRNTLYRKLGRM